MSRVGFFGFVGGVLVLILLAQVLDLLILRFTVYVAGFTLDFGLWRFGVCYKVERVAELLISGFFLAGVDLVFWCLLWMFLFVQVWVWCF